MDRVKSSMQQVPNAIPKVIRRTGGANSLELERENFERGQVRETTGLRLVPLIQELSILVVVAGWESWPSAAVCGGRINSHVGWLLSAHKPKPHWKCIEVAHFFYFSFIYYAFSFPSLHPCLCLAQIVFLPTCLFVFGRYKWVHCTTIELLKCGSMVFWVRIAVLLSLSAAQTRKDSDRLKLHGAV